jgi:carbon monoxide dehydrogenase subunit G
VKLTGAFTFNAPRDRVWAILNDPAILRKHMPGCESLEATGTDEFKATLKVGVAAIKGTYIAKLSITDKAPPERYTLHVEGQGGPGFVKGAGTVTLAADGAGTRLSYDGDLQFGGLIARVGGRLLSGITEKMTRDFFESLGKEAEG